MKEDDNIRIKDLSTKQYIPLKKDSKNNNFEYIVKFTFASIIFVAILLIFICHIDNRSNQLLKDNIFKGIFMIWVDEEKFFHLTPS